MLEAWVRKRSDADHQVFLRSLIEKWIDGKEITVGVLDVADGIKPLPVIEIRTPGGWIAA